MEESVKSLQLRVSQLEEELEDKLGKLYKAAEFGNTLLSTNQLLNDKLEAREKEHSVLLEEVEQENYTLKMKLECQLSSTSSLHQELEESRSQFERQLATAEKRLSEVHSRKMSELNSCNDDLKSEMEKLNVQIQTYQEKLKKQEDVMEQLREEATLCGNTSQLHNELIDLETMYTNERTRREALEFEALERACQLEIAVIEVSKLQQKLAGLEEECQERNKTAKEYQDALQVANDHTAELSSKLELLKCQDMDGTTHANGNSLFGEVDDRRINVERQMISLKIKHESLERTHATTKQQLKKMKAEINALLCQYSATAADAAQVQRLQRALNQSKSEIQSLTSKLHRVERQQTEAVAIQDVKSYMSAFVGFGDKAEYIHFLEQELEQEKKLHASVTTELDLKRSQLLWESNKLSEAESRLHQAQQEQAKLRKDRSKLHLKAQEVMEELDQVKSTCKQHEAEKKYLEDELKSKGNQRKHVSKPTPRQPVDSTTTDENMPSELTAAATPPDDSKKMAAAPHPRKEINILEDLDKEFNKRVMLKPEDIMSCLDAPREEKLFSIASCEAKKPDKDITVEESSLTRIVHVNNKDSVNKCPQQ